MKQNKEDSVIQKVLASLVTNKALPAQTATQFETMYADLDRLVDFLLSDGIVTRRDILYALSETFQVPWFDVTGYFFDHQLLKLFPKDFLLRSVAIPLLVDEDELVVVTADPTDSNIVAGFGQYVSYEIEFNVGIRRHIEDAIKEFYDKSVSYDTPEDLDLEEERRLARDEAQLEQLDDEDLEKLSDIDE